MTSNYALLISAILTALADVGGEAPEGPIYAAMMVYGGTLNEFDVIITSLEGAGLVTRPAAHIMSLTAKGTELAQRLATVLPSDDEEEAKHEEGL